MLEFSKPFLDHLIEDQVQEHAGLEYKAAAALGRSDKHKLDITKDVSAIANAAGGTLVYGIAEHHGSDRP